jgi:hypothetical protein
MAKAIPTPHYAKVFCARKTLRVFLIGHKKPSFTAETLYAMPTGFKGLMKRIRMLFGLSSFLTLILGMCVYLFFRDLSNMIIFKFVPKPEFAKTVLVPLKPSVFSYFIKYNLPYVLWFLSGILLMRYIWFFNIKAQRVYVFCVYGLGFLYVMCKLLEKFPGTFDWLDLLFMGIGAFVEGLLYKFYVRRKIV